jgi:hypothetical protein
MITKTEIEALAVRFAAISDIDRNAVLTRAAEIARKVIADFADVEEVEGITKTEIGLAVGEVDFVMSHGFVEEVDGEWKLKTAKLGVVT